MLYEIITRAIGSLVGHIAWELCKFLHKKNNRPKPEKLDDYSSKN